MMVERATATTMYMLTLTACCVLDMKRAANCFSRSVALTSLSNTSMPASAFSTEWKEYG